jgi:hypothetical protein
MTSAEESEKLTAELAGIIQKLVDHAVDERIEPIRALLIKDASPEETQVGPMGDADAVAELLGLDLSSDEKRKAARQRVYYLARIKAIPSTRISPRRLMFDLDKVKRAIADASIPPTLNPAHRG